MTGLIIALWFAGFVAIGIGVVFVNVAPDSVQPRKMLEIGAIVAFFGLGMVVAGMTLVVTR
jgi:hypothetical protein